MKKEIIYKGECVGRVIVFGARADVIFTPKETALFTSRAPRRPARTGSGRRTRNVHRLTHPAPGAHR